MIESANPYAPPTAEDDAAPQAAVAGELRLAGLGRRFAANWIDLIFLCSPAFIYGMVEGGLGKLGPIGQDGDAWAGLLMIPFLIIHWILLATSGQSLGKKLLGLKIVKPDGSRAGFLPAVVWRGWVPLMVAVFIGALLPTLQLARLVMFIDVLFIFGRERRCLHDYLAGTQVIRL